jgi:hypothetical protein
MTAVRRYEATMYDSNRWDGFELRPGDIIISAPPKCGTTWTQMICALLILQEPELPLPLDTLSPWIDMVTRAQTDVFRDLEAQTHRRVHQDPHAARRDTQRSDGHLHLRRAGPARRGAVDAPPY